jgi:hypothetical protein
LSFFIILLISEGVSSLVFCKSDSFGFTLSAQCWNNRYWKPINEFGFRDTAWKSKDLSNNQLIIVVGDSFVAGTGIENIKDRFPERLLVHLNGSYSVIILAKKGWGPIAQTHAIKDLPYAPLVVVYSYFINDIEDAYSACGLSHDFSIESPPKLGSWYIQNSYLLNTFYWRFIRHFHSGLSTKYWKGVENGFNNTDCFKAHTTQLRELLDSGQTQDSQKIAVLFPNLLDPKSSVDILKKVEYVYSKEGVSVINLSQKLITWNVSDLVVNNLDSHPSIQLHDFVATEIANRLTKLLAHQ